jgi:phosphoglycerate-specific signal transduction histidine kinase
MRLPSSRDEETAALLHQLSEALTALGNYLAVVHRKFANEGDPEPEMRDLLAKSRAQYERAAETVRRLRALLRRETGIDGDRGDCG